MSTSPSNKRGDPLVDAYHQASEVEAKFLGAQPRPALREAVLAHARVVSQSTAKAEPKLAVSETVRSTPAANESRPIWRIAAGVVLGVVGLWVYQLTRPGSIDEDNVTVFSAPQNAKASANETTVAVSPPAAPTVAPPAAPAVSVASAAATAPTKPTSVVGPAQAETAIALATPSRTDKTVRDTPARERASTVDEIASSSGLSGSIADAARDETSVAVAKLDARARRVEPTAAPTAQTAVAAAAPVAPSATLAIPESAPTEPPGETMIASAELRKAARPGAAARASVAAAPVTAAPPTAFPANATGAMASAAPPPAAPAAIQQSAASGGNSALRQGVINTPDAAMFSAVRIGNVNALRASLARGANVNSRDETGRSALQIAHERNDADMVKALELAGAK